MAKSSQKGLGKGLGALFADPVTPVEPQKQIQVLPIQKLEPNRAQPRRDFDEEALGELAASISEHGLIQPIAVRQMEKRLLSDHCWRTQVACIQIGWAERGACKYHRADDQTAAELTLIENLQREDLNPMEEARG